MVSSSSPCCRLHGFITVATLAAAWLQIYSGCDAFSFPRIPLTPPSNHNGLMGGCGGDGGSKRPGMYQRHFYDGDGSESGDELALNLASLHWMIATSDHVNGSDISDISVNNDSNEEVSSKMENSLAPTPTDILRGGGVASKKSNSDSNKSVGSSINDSIDSLQTMLFKPFSLAGSTLSKSLPANPFKKSDNDKSLEKKQELLSSTTVQSVSAPNSQLLTPDAVTQCAKESNLIGGTLTPETLEMTANKINRLYLENGYVMNSVTGATLVPPSDGNEKDGEGHVELKVREVKLARPRERNSSPVHIRFVEKIKDAASDDDDESVFSLPSQSSDQSTSSLQTYRTVSGRTRPAKIARMVKLVPGSHFQILPQLWSQLASFPGSGIFGGGGRQPGKAAIFSTIHAVRPVPTSQENTVEVEIIATENKPVSLEYGVTKSLYSDQWEGELDLRHSNVFGGGEVATVNVRKGKGSGSKEDSGLMNWKKGVTGGPVSWRMSIKDDYLAGSNSGYDLEVFRDYVGVSRNRGSHQKVAVDSEIESSEGIESEAKEGADEIESPLRTGATMRLRLPQTNTILPKAISARFERVDPFVKDDCAQCMASMSTDIGPYHHELEVSSRPIRSTVSATATAGGKWNAGGKAQNGGVDASTLPYATGTLTSQQTIPLSGGTRPSVDFAMRHVISASSKHLPRHEAVLLGLSSRIRGYKYNYQQSPVTQQPQTTEKDGEKSILQSLKKLVTGNGSDQFRPPIALSNSMSGTVELRIPFERAIREPIFGRGSFILFGDWCIAKAQPPSSSILMTEDAVDQYDKLFRHSSIGFGLRKVVQGIPLKVDACVTEHGRKGIFFGIGQGFGV